ncbi:complement component 1 Q subcomponent-binding protein, mitochondrial-like [Rhagoletis pomonella]|uniref:complement component 1 Q subcomponent-binding protein, mitochondrial-like n=1 Tax=Rhagoletis pomonella TaxID=28610 RepID=UPI00178314EC|nr:complement component 1 Q subcomponent-binding protein, mitochondrial-like [Rhagoletis pomonella]
MFENPEASGSLQKSSLSYGGAKHMHTKGERELVEFLTDEILAERKSPNISTNPTTLDSFSVKRVDGDVELTKKSDTESIVINFTANHTVDPEDEPELDLNAEIGKMRSKTTL